jgi:hypothetical protein
MKQKIECYLCKWGVALGDGYFNCKKPSEKVRGYVALVKMGLFHYPLNYKAGAKRTKCPNFTLKGE